MPDRKTPPKIVDAVDYSLHLKPCTKFTLDNGVEVYTIDAGAEEVLALEWVFFAGNSQEETNLVAATANFMLRNGTSKKNAFQINEYFDYWGSYLNRSCFNETATISLHCLNKHVGELLPAVRELITDSVIPEDELNTYRQNMKQRLKVNLRKSDFVATRMIDVYLYGKEHPYGKYSSEEEYDALNREQLMDFYRRYYQQGKLIIFAAGRIPADLEKQLNKSFGDLPNTPTPVKTWPRVLATEKKYRINNDPDVVQGSIRMGRPFPNRHHPDFAKVQVLNCVFGGFFGSRLMSNIREEKGYTYGIHSFVQNHIQDSAWVISTEAGKDVCEATITEIHKEMKLLRDEPVDADELALVRNYLIGGVLGDLDGPFQIIARWKNLILHGLDDQHFYKTIEIIKTATAVELQEMANKYLREEDFYELVVI
ncbi:MAG: insulinase family protein [Chitinophagaceae bacterium]|nr:insulinase family protein [Chitinophagaceae bacterium]